MGRREGYYKEYYQKNKQKLNDRQKAYYSKNAGKRKEYQKEYYNTHKEEQE